MKKALLVAVALLMFASVANAQGPPMGYIALVTGESHSAWCVNGVGFYPAEMWIMCLPSYLGQICAEFRVCYPANVIQSTVTWNTALISVSLGDLPSGLSVCFVACQNAWLWIAHQALWVTDPTQTFIYICPHPDVGVYQFANCTVGYPTEPCIKWTNFYLNRDPITDELCGTTATEDASWGAIKSMME